MPEKTVQRSRTIPYLHELDDEPMLQLQVAAEEDLLGKPTKF